MSVISPEIVSFKQISKETEVVPDSDKEYNDRIVL